MPRLGTVGQVGRSRNAQTADKRARRLRNPRREKVCTPSPLSLSSFLLSAAIAAAATTTIANTITATSSPPAPRPPFLPPPPPPPPLDRLAPPPTIVSSPQPRTVYKQILPPFQRLLRQRASARLPWIDRRRRSARSTAGRCASDVVALRSWWLLTRLHCAKLEAATGAPAEESDLSERVLEKLPRRVRPLHPSIPPVRPPARSLRFLRPSCPA